MQEQAHKLTAYFVRLLALAYLAELKILNFSTNDV